MISIEPRRTSLLAQPQPPCRSCNKMVRGFYPTAPLGARGILDWIFFATYYAASTYINTTRSANNKSHAGFPLLDATGILPVPILGATDTQRRLTYRFIRLQRISSADRKSITLKFSPFRRFRISLAGEKVRFPGVFRESTTCSKGYYAVFLGFSAGQKIRSQRMALFSGKTRCFGPTFCRSAFSMPENPKFSAQVRPDRKPFTLAGSKVQSVINNALSCSHDDRLYTSL